MLASCSGCCLAFRAADGGNNGGPKPSLLEASHSCKSRRVNELARGFVAVARVKHMRLSTGIAQL
jgi:hypothetical protein